jgi:hypothetical protein
MKAEREAVAVADARALWGAPLLAAGCAACGRAHLVPEARAGGPCPACFAAPLTPQPALLRLEPPELVVPIRVTAEAAAPGLEAFARSVWLRPAGLAGAALSQRLTAGYLPMWLVDAEAAGQWEAQAGYDYHVASATEHYSGGQWVTQQVKETRIRWEPRAGRVRRAYANTPVPALEDHAALMQALGAFPLEVAQPYAPEAAAEAVVRVPALPPEAAWPFARARLDERVMKDVQAAAGAQHVDQAKLKVDYGRQHWTLLLLPVYTSAYQDDDGRWRLVLVNGHSGQVSGERRASLRLAWRWTALIGLGALALFVLGLLVSALGLLLPPVVALGGLLMVLSVVVGLAAPAPVVWAWRFNAG